MNLPFEPVLTMTDYYDGPRRGIANYKGKPHLYESQWKDLDSDESDQFLLTPLPDHVVELALEDWGIWLRWEKAFQEGETSEATHPALPNDRQRHEHLSTALNGELVTDPARAISARGIFRVPSESSKSYGWRELEVQWLVVSGGG